MASTVKIFNIAIPEKNGLCCAICRIIVGKNDNSMHSDFCSNRIKCREFLQETPQAMVAPIVNRKILQAGGSIYIIIAKEFFESYTFQDHCDSLNVYVMDVLESVPAYIYKACLLYTMEYKLAPQWNKVGLYLVEGQDFLSSTGRVNAVTLDIKSIHGNNARLQVEAVNLKIPYVRLNTMRSLQSDIHPPVRVLPSMKMANVLCISNTINEKCAFKNYDHLRAYWKDMHGYILPDHKEGLLYYEIEFFYYKSKIFLYPETCLTSGPVQILSSMIDPVPIIYKLAGELRGKVPRLCGQQFDICLENTYQATVLASTPTLPRIGMYSSYDTGYGSQSRRINSVTSPFRIPDTREIPTKRTRLSLLRTNKSLAYETESDDLDFGISPVCSTSNFQPILHNADDMSTICKGDIVAGRSIMEMEESTSQYFTGNKPYVKQTDEEENMDELSLKEKLLNNGGNNIHN